MKTTNSETIQARIYISGPIDVIEQVCRRECFRAGLCVTVTPTKFIYTGGEETGAAIGLCNYPLYQATHREIEDRAMLLARGLLVATYQRKAMVVTDDKTTVIEAAQAGKACSQCGRLVEKERECYAVPTCHVCLPPPEPLPVRKAAKAGKGEG